jgi:hypothetical protein
LFFGQTAIVKDRVFTIKKAIRRKTMGYKKTIKHLVMLIILTLVTPLALFAEEGDIVKTISVCGPDAFIEMQEAGMVVVRESDVGKDVLDEILSRAISLSNSGEATGYFDPGNPVELCGLEQVRPITILD